MAPIRLLIADDHRLFRRGLVSLFVLHKEFEVVGEANDGAEAVDKAQELAPDIILMDVRMPILNGFEALKRIRVERPDVCIIMLTASEEDNDLSEAMSLGARGYIIKTMEPDDLFRQLHDVAQGGTAWPSRSFHA